MHKIERLLQTLAPKGVEFRKLGEVCEILDNRRIPIAKNKEIREFILIMEQMEFKIILIAIFLMGILC
ncbi:specificity subunit S of type I restriction-modification system [Helicobacter pylori Hp A-5]|nr:specificity subunit S of type I restriction-modification system [Helicobacter pylori Hp A-5]